MNVLYFMKLLKNSSKDDWKIEILEACNKEQLKKMKQSILKTLKSYDPNIGYNYFIADNKPIDGFNKKRLWNKKLQSKS